MSTKSVIMTLGLFIQIFFLSNGNASENDISTQYFDFSNSLRFFLRDEVELFLDGVDNQEELLNVLNNYITNHVNDNITSSKSVDRALRTLCALSLRDNNEVSKKALDSMVEYFRNPRSIPSIEPTYMSILINAFGENGNALSVGCLVDASTYEFWNDIGLWSSTLFLRGKIQPSLERVYYLQYKSELAVRRIQELRSGLGSDKDNQYVLKYLAILDKGENDPDYIHPSILEYLGEPSPPVVEGLPSFFLHPALLEYLQKQSSTLLWESLN